MHLANLTNEVIFKKVFTNVEVFTAFVKDVLGLDIEIDKVETERELNRETAHIRFRMDLFAESKDHRVIVGLSIHNPENPGINLSKPAIRKAAELFELDRIDPRELIKSRRIALRKKMTVGGSFTTTIHVSKMGRIAADFLRFWDGVFQSCRLAAECCAGLLCMNPLLRLESFA